ncbi:MAG: AraC family transcriptional regulator [Calditrichaeota bacterium]|nr:MAG: AraC family transcriptional regulator [Calditrichota bacterium]
MKYTEKIVSHEQLKGDVLCYWQMSGIVDTRDGVKSRYIPKGQNLLIFNTGDEIEAESNSPQTPFFILPAIKSSMMVNQKGKIDLFGISFIGEGLFKLIQLPIPKIAELSNTLKQKLEDLHTEIKRLNFPEKTIVAEKFLLTNLNQNLTSQHIQKSLELINKKKGVMRVSELAEEVGISERQLQRLFRNRIGVSPKDYCKIVRVNSYIEYFLEKGSAVDWMDLVVEYNYHDQPHLINEVKAIAKLSPKKLLQYRDTLYHRYTLD